MKSGSMHNYVAAEAHTSLTTGEVIKMLHELKEWTQKTLAQHSGISITDLSLLENGKVDIGKKRAEQFAKAFDVHPAIIMFPEYEAIEIKRAS